MNTENQIEIYQANDGSTQINVQFEQDTVWLNQAQMAELFGKGRTTITEHIQNVFTEGELLEEVVCRDFRHTTQHGAIKGKSHSNIITPTRNGFIHRDQFFWFTNNFTIFRNFTC